MAHPHARIVIKDFADNISTVGLTPDGRTIAREKGKKKGEKKNREAPR